MSMLGTAVSGMLANSNWLSTISQNIANANTTGYKNSETDFSAIVDQAGSASSAGGGVDTSVQNLNSLQGNVVGTTVPTDLAIQGDGYFIVSDSSGNTFLTRNGSFVPDAQGDLVNSAGYYLMGKDVQNGQPTGSISVGDLTKVNVTTSGELDTPTTSGALSLNLDASATTVAAADLPSVYPNTANTAYTSETSMVTYDNLGGSQTINLYLTNAGPNAAGDPTWEVDAYSAADASAGGGFPYSAAPLATGTLTFNPTTGALTGVTETVGGVTTTTASTFSLTVPNGRTMSLDLSSTTQLESAFAVNASSANGNAAGTLTGTSFSSNGTLSFIYSNGETNPGYDIPLATVASEDNLTSVNGDAYEANEASGAIRPALPGNSGLGTLVSSSLEDSTVDLATELTQMIEAQSSYQANSKVFQTGADLLDVLNNLKA